MKNKEKEKLVIKKLKELALKIERHNHLYHNLDKPIITDSAYDNIVKENNKLEKLYPHLVLKKGPNKKIISKIKSKFEKIKHVSQMFSLANAFNENDILEFIKKTNKYLNKPDENNFKFLCEPKIDGLSLNLLYKKGKLISASTRGDGFTGENVTENIREIKNIPKMLNDKFPELIEIRGRGLYRKI